MYFALYFSAFLLNYSLSNEPFKTGSYLRLASRGKLPLTFSPLMADPEVLYLSLGTICSALSSFLILKVDSNLLM